MRREEERTYLNLRKPNNDAATNYEIVLGFDFTVLERTVPFEFCSVATSNFPYSTVNCEDKFQRQSPWSHTVLHLSTDTSPSYSPYPRGRSPTKQSGTRMCSIDNWARFGAVKAARVSDVVVYIRALTKISSVVSCDSLDSV